MKEPNSPGKIVTFYSYKGGTGRSMVLANVAWILASNGKRVLTIDWDLEAPGLHRYFAPFLVDKGLTESEGVIDFVTDFAVAALTPMKKGEEVPNDWYLDYAHIIRYATSLDWNFLGDGTLDFIPAGRQGVSYSSRVNSFNWHDFYDRLGGGAFLEAVKEKMQMEYDYILIDSRTGVSDTSGICTVQMPDILVVCYTLNNQGVEGAAAVAHSIYDQRKDPNLLVFPVPMRLENAEKQKLESRKEYASSLFSKFPAHLPEDDRELYRAEIQFPYIPYYAYEELLATFGDRPGEAGSLLAATERLTSYITKGEVKLLVAPSESERIEVLSIYEGKPAFTPTALVPVALAANYVTRQDKDGRDILESLKEELSPPKTQVIALWGAGGVGKTTLAAEAAHGLATFFSNILWISVSGRENFTFSTFLNEIANSLGRSDLSKLVVEIKTEQVRRLIGAAPTLVVLDSFEIIPVEQQALCLKFLTESSCSALITTRQKIETVHNIAIGPMSLQEAEEYLEKLINQSHDLQTIGMVERKRIIQTAEANPLVMKWVIAQIDLAQEPQEVLDDLARGEGEAASRIFDRSFNLPQLSNGGRAVLLALSLFVPSATRPAVSEVAGLSKDKKRFREAVKQLASLWLISTTDAGQRLMVEGLTRYLAQAHLSMDPRSKIFRHRYISHFLNYAEMHNKPNIEDFSALYSEKDNIFNAVEIALEVQDWQSAVRLVIAIGGQPNSFLETRGYWDEMMTFSERAAAAAHAMNDEETAALLLGNAATIRLKRGEFTQAKEIHERALSIFRKTGNTINVAMALHNLGFIAQEQGQLEEARGLYSKSLQIRHQLGDRTNIVNTLRQLARLAEDLGDFNEAARLNTEALEISKELGDQVGTALALSQLGDVTFALNNLAEAEKLYQESLEIKKRLGDQSGMAVSLHDLGRIAQRQQRFHEAERLYKESLEISTRLGEQYQIASNLQQLGVVATNETNIAQARQLFNESLRIYRKINSRVGIATCLHNLAAIAEREGNIAEALKLLEESLGIWVKLRSPNVQNIRSTLETLKDKVATGTNVKGSEISGDGPLGFNSCFISYSHKDEEFARKLYSRLREENIRVWFAPENVKVEESVTEQVSVALQTHDKIILIISENSIQSSWVKEEIRNARKAEVKEHRRKLFPIRLVDFEIVKQWKCFDEETGKDLAIEVREYFIPDFSNWKISDTFEVAFGKLLQDVKASID